MNPDTPPVKMTEADFEQLMQVVLLNQLIEGFRVTSQEEAIVRAILRKQHNPK